MATGLTGFLDQIMAYEAGEMEYDETVEFFQELIDTGFAWELQGSYGRAARDLILAGECTMPGRV